MIAVEVPVGRSATMARGLGVIFVASVLFGIMAVCVRVASVSIPALQIAFVRFGGSLLILRVLGRRHSLRPNAAQMRHLLLRGLLGASAIVLYYVGIETAGAGFATLLDCTYPVFTALFAARLMKEPLSGRVTAALVLNVIGVSVVLGPARAVSPQLTLGGCSSLGAAVLAGAAVATARHLRATENATLITTYFMAVGVAMTAPALLMGMPHPAAAQLLALAGVVVTSVAGQWLLHHGLGFASATQGSLAAATSVVTAAGLGALLLGEQLSSATLVGSSLMIAAVGLAVQRR